MTLTFLSNEYKWVIIPITLEVAIDCNLNALERLLACFFNEFWPTLHYAYCKVKTHSKWLRLHSDALKYLCGEYKQARGDANNTTISTKMQLKRIRMVLNVFTINYNYVCIV